MRSAQTDGVCSEAAAFAATFRHLGAGSSPGATNFPSQGNRLPEQKITALLGGSARATEGNLNEMLTFHSAAYLGFLFSSMMTDAEAASFSLINIDRCVEVFISNDELFIISV